MSTIATEPTICLGDKSVENFPAFKEEQVNYSLELCSQHYRFGLSHQLLSAEQWQVLPNNTFEDMNGDIVANPVPEDAIKPPGPHVNDGPNQRAAKAHLLTIFNDEKAAQKSMKKFLLKGAGPVNELLLGGPTEIRNITSREIYARLCELYDEIDEPTVTAWTKALDVPHSASDSITKTVGNHAQINARLAAAGHALRDFDKLVKLKQAFAAFPAVVTAIHEYEVLNPLLSDRTSQALSNHLIRQQSVITTGSMGFTANAALTRADVQAMMQTAIADAYQQGLAAGRGAGGGRGAPGGGRGAADGRGAGGRGAGGGRGGRFGGRGAPAGAPRHYCYLHGYDGHNSARCREMAADATYTAVMKSAVSHTAVPGGSERNL